MKIKIAMVGTGYVGLVTGSCFAALGHDVICIDNDSRKINLLLAGKMPIYEPGLAELVQRNVEEGRLRFSRDRGFGQGSGCGFYRSWHPVRSETGRADLRYVRSAAIEVARALMQDTVLVTKSTVPVGSNDEIAKLVAPHLGPNVNVHIASNPEFLREGAAINDFMEPDRIVVGAVSEHALRVMRAIYAPLVEQEVPLVVTSVKTAEAIKYAANAFLAVKVSFINEISDLCEAVGADVEDLARGIGLDKRIGASFLRTGPGWGGSCFPKDTMALRLVAQDAKTPVTIVDAAVAANSARKKAMAKRIVGLCGGDVQGKTVALLGLTFKGQTDDMRDSPSLDIVAELERAGAIIQAYDPSNPHDAGKLLPNVRHCASVLEAASGGDILVVVTDWKVLKAIDYAAVAAVMKRPLMLDLRNMLDEASVRASGFQEYHRLGK